MRDSRPLCRDWVEENLDPTVPRADLVKICMEKGGYGESTARRAINIFKRKNGIEPDKKVTSAIDRWLEDNYNEEEPIEDLINRCSIETTKCRSGILTKLWDFCRSHGLRDRLNEVSDADSDAGTIAVEDLIEELDYVSKTKNLIDEHMTDKFIFDDKLRLRIGMTIRQWEEVRQDPELKSRQLTYTKGANSKKVTVWSTSENVNKMKNNPKLGINIYD